MLNIESVITDIIEKAKEDEYASHDVSDLMQTQLYALTSKLPPGKLKKIVQAPYKLLINKAPDLLRQITGIKKHKYPQGHAMVIRAIVELSKISHPNGDLEEAEKLAEWLIKNRSPHSEHYGWGQPFMWYSRKPFPPNTPRATVSSQVGWAFLDLYEQTGKEEYLKIAVDICYLFINEFNYTKDQNGNFCLSYTTLDNYHIHNASMLAASMIIRVSSITGSNELKEFGLKLVDFTLSHQNKDGSFYYWAPPDKLIYKIDNYHTGFVLESLSCINQDIENPKYREAYDLGMEFYLENLFDGPIPLLSTKKRYPIDIQSCAQSILTFTASGLDEKFKSKAFEVAEYTVKNFFLSNKRHFAYRLYANGKLDESYYFRWGDAWMLRALANLLKYD